MSKKQFGKRLLQILIVLIGVSFFTFGLTYLSPGDPAEIMLTECGNLPTPELLEQTRHELGLDQPFLVIPVISLNRDSCASRPGTPPAAHPSGRAGA